MFHHACVQRALLRKRSEHCQMRRAHLAMSKNGIATRMTLLTRGDRGSMRGSRIDDLGCLTFLLCFRPPGASGGHQDLQGPPIEDEDARQKK